MAFIDKIYATKAQYLKFKEWSKEYAPDIFDHLQRYVRDGDLDGEWPEEWNDYDEYPIANLSEESDKWLLKNCPLKFVIDRINEQYS